MGGRMAAWYAGSAALLLVVATTSLYGTMAAGLDADGDQWLCYSIDYLKNYLARTGRLPDPDDWPADDILIRDGAGRVLFASPAARDRLPPGAGARRAGGQLSHGLGAMVPRPRAAGRRADLRGLLRADARAGIAGAIPALHGLRADPGPGGVGRGRRDDRPPRPPPGRGDRGDGPTDRTRAAGRAHRHRPGARRAGRPGPDVQRDARPAPGVLRPPRTVLRRHRA